MNPATFSCPGPMSRRNFLQIGSLALGGLGLSGLVPWKLSAAERGEGETTPDTSVILIWLPGGPPHMETYDLKPDAPAEFRGEFRPMRTVVPGMDICELLPMHAQVADKFNLIRSIAHDFADHGGGHKRFLTGRDPRSPVDSSTTIRWSARWSTRLRGERRDGVPNYVAGMDIGRQGIDVFAFGSAYLGPSVHPFTVPGDPSRASFQVPNLRATQSRGTAAATARPAQPDRHGQRRPMTSPAPCGPWTLIASGPWSLLTTDAARRAFDLEQETTAVRERYGMHPYGQRCLLARRLVEAGASFVTMVLENPTIPGQPMPPGVTYNWDLHAVNGHIFDDSRFRFPIYDRAVIRPDRGHLRPRPGSQGDADRHRRIRPDAAHHLQRRPAGPRSLARGDVRAGLRGRHAHGPGHRLDQLPRRTSARTPADARTICGPRCSSTWASTTPTRRSSTTPAGPCRFCRMARRSTSCGRMIVGLVEYTDLRRSAHSVVRGRRFSDW